MVALKSLMLVLRVFQDGDPYYPREVFYAMKRGAKILNLTSFRDESSYTSRWDFTSFVRTFALYLDERLDCFLTGKLQQRRHANDPAYQHGKRPSESVLDMKPVVLLDRITYWQRLLDRAIATRPTGEARVNRLVLVCLYDVVLESFDLYKDISDGLSIILDSFFQLQFQNCVNAFHACAKAAKQFKELNNFYNLCKSIGVGRSCEYPTVQSILEDQIVALQQFLNEQSTYLSSNSNAIMPTQEKARDKETSLRSEVGLSCASLQDLINATATKTAACQAISIDLEAYADPPQRDEAFTLSESASVKSLPVSYSRVDLISLWDEPDLDDPQQQQQQQKHHDLQQLSPYDNWEVVMAKTLASPSPLTSPALLPISENKQARTGSFSENWELILFEPEPEPEPEPDLQTCTNNYYNPFLVDPMEAQSLQRAVTLPTFRAVAQFQDQTPFLGHNEMDHFSSLDQQFLRREQQQWLMN